MIKMDLVFTVKGYYFDNLLKEHSTIEEVVENLDHRINALRLEIGSYTNDERIREKQVFLSKSKAKKDWDKEIIVRENESLRNFLKQVERDSNELVIVIYDFDDKDTSDSIYILDYPHICKTPLYYLDVGGGFE